MYIADNFLGATPLPSPASYNADQRRGAENSTVAAATKTEGTSPIRIVPPTSTTQAAAVSKSMVEAWDGPESGGKTEMARIVPAERTLKPYGVLMLPHAADGPDTSHSGGMIDEARVRPGQAVD
jgi:hypothetical protein